MSQPQPQPARPIHTSPYRFKAFQGSGLAVVRRSRPLTADDHNESEKDVHADFTHLSFTFPLKLISPRAASHDAVARIVRQHGAQLVRRSQIKPVAALYVVGYGGGLVSGDAVQLDVDVGQGCTMVLLTQGSTKVYKMRSQGQYRRTDEAAASTETVTSQTFRCIVQPDAALIVLPDPVTCFARAKYVQTQQFDLRDRQSSSLVLLDWFTPGRMHLVTREGKQSTERWAFSRYTSRNEVRLAGRRVIVRDILSLEQTDEQALRAEQNNDPGPVADKCEPYTCFATLVLIGPDTTEVVRSLKQTFHAIQQHQKRGPRRTGASGDDDVLWSCSAVTVAEEDSADGETDTGGLVVRVAGLTTESVRYWLRMHLSALKMIVGDDLYRLALG